MKIPDELRYTKEHEWIRIEDDGETAVIGVTDFAQGELGDIVFVEIEPVDSEIDKDEPFGTVEAVKTVSELFMPLSGRIAEINEELEAHPEYVNDDPYGEGWMVKIRLSDPDESHDLLDADQYASMIG
ncbi:MAG: glycine cleavage system protein GcvH [Rhodothermales bacterium]